MGKKSRLSGELFFAIITGFLRAHAGEVKRPPVRLLEITISCDQRRLVKLWEPQFSQQKVEVSPEVALKCICLMCGQHYAAVVLKMQYPPPHTHSLMS